MEQIAELSRGAQLGGFVVGTHAKTVATALTFDQTASVLGSVETGLLDILRRAPLSRIEFSSAMPSPRFRGYYQPESGLLVINHRRDVGSFGIEMVAGTTLAISSTGSTYVEALAITLHHELGHVVADLLASRSEDPLTEVRRLGAQKLLRPISALATFFTPDEYFAETFAAFRFYPAVLRDHDPEGYNLISRLMQAVRR